ncbi:large conductance mechanosensitive channel protein MscL [Nesterenkonia flava]|uniref:Large-conductance mechanosensitive channel n=1 Tax=Nesterenkonia flava TaxID=469799 RepID=A0ABU1FQM3_9MICC|nr:large conductance mechanosensitive channel protein MscL [Nesterenkonia flava]MDR5710918.1 large conductance mechanosensitive channel protein MscL [Nesterenkonia flava]
MLKGFFQFIKQGNVIDLAVAVVLGAAFTGIVNALVDSILMPLIAQLVGGQEPDLNYLWAITLPGMEGPPMRFGVLATATVNFLLIAAAIYFFVILPMNKMIEARNKKFGEPEEEPEENVLLLREIRDQLKAQTEVTNPAYIASLVEAERRAEDEAKAAEEAEKNAGLFGKARNIVWGKD